VGLRYAYEGGFDVNRGPLPWKRFLDKYGDQNRVLNFFLGGHSQASARIRNLEREIVLNYREHQLRGFLTSAKKGTLAPAACSASVPIRTHSIFYIKRTWKNTDLRQRMTPNNGNNLRNPYY
jgi:hypothetical protein